MTDTRTRVQCSNVYILRLVESVGGDGAVMRVMCIRDRSGARPIADAPGMEACVGGRGRRAKGGGNEGVRVVERGERGRERRRNRVGFRGM